METNKKHKEKLEKKNTRRSEVAINEREVDGKEINHQQQDRREIHQPRDNA